MAVTIKRKTKPEGGRSEVFALRLDPKLKYLADLAARKQRRSIANYIEWAVEQALRQTRLDDDDEESVWTESETLWHVSEIRRFLSLLTYHAELLSYEEQQILHVIKTVTADDPDHSMTLGFIGKDKRPIESALEKCWAEIKALAKDSTKETRQALEHKMYLELSPD
jgi:hypothetical protein